MDSRELTAWIVNEGKQLHGAGDETGPGDEASAEALRRAQNDRDRDRGFFVAKKSGLIVVTLVATLNPVSQVLW